MVKIILHGCNGRMGRVITNLVEKDENVEIVAGVDVFQKIDNEYPVFSSINECNVEADVIIDFANVSAVDDLLEYSRNKKVPVVLCTTGLSKEQVEKIDVTAKEVAIVYSANMSLGINTLFKILSSISSLLSNAGFDIEIVEKHHNQKLDAPSGTALALADVINEELNGELEYVYNRSDVRQKRGKKELGISAVRGGTIVGEHEIIFAGEEEVIEIKHTAYSRNVFAKGAIEAAKFLKNKEPKKYTMRDVVK